MQSVSVNAGKSPQRPNVGPSTAIKDRWLLSNQKRPKRTHKSDKVYREARRHVSRLVRQNRRLASTNGAETP